MKNIQVIDGADNTEYAIYAVTNDEFAMMFPGERQNVEFIEDLLKRTRKCKPSKLFVNVWPRRVAKPEVCGIHGTLFYELDWKKKYYPRKNDAEMGMVQFPELAGQAQLFPPRRSEFQVIRGRTKNMQVVDAAEDCAYAIFAVTGEEFDAIFTGRRTDIAFIEDLVARLGRNEAGNLLKNIWRRRVEKPEVRGIHGTLLYGLRPEKKTFFAAPPGMKNIQVIDRAGNTEYALYAVTEEEFAAIFPGERQNVEFSEDLSRRLGRVTARRLMKAVWHRRIEKPKALGIHGTLFFGLPWKREYYPAKNDEALHG